MISRQKLQAIKKMVRANTALPAEQAQVLHSLIDHGLECLDKIDGGQPMLDAQQALREAEGQVRLALADLRAALDAGDVKKAQYTSVMIDEMLAAKLRNRGRWDWYVARIAEEFDE